MSEWRIRGLVPLPSNRVVSAACLAPPATGDAVVVEGREVSADCIAPPATGDAAIQAGPPERRLVIELAWSWGTPSAGTQGWVLPGKNYEYNLSTPPPQRLPGNGWGALRGREDVGPLAGPFPLHIDVQYRGTAQPPGIELRVGYYSPATMSYTRTGIDTASPGQDMFVPGGPTMPKRWRLAFPDADPSHVQIRRMSEAVFAFGPGPSPNPCLLGLDTSYAPPPASVTLAYSGAGASDAGALVTTLPPELGGGIGVAFHERSAGAFYQAFSVVSGGAWFVEASQAQGGASVAMWVKATGERSVVIRLDDSATGVFSLVLSLATPEAGTPGIIVQGAINYVVPFLPQDGAWHHHAAIYAGPSSSVSYYLDGVLTGSGFNFAASTLIRSVNRLRVEMQQPAGLFDASAGCLNPVAFCRALTPAEVASLAAGNMPDADGIIP